MILKVLYRFLVCYIVLWQYAVKLDSNDGSPTRTTLVLRVFYII